jgi:magnesium chelatase subunit D
VLNTDGRHNAGGEPGAAAGLLRRDGVAAVVIDCESGPVRLGLAAGLARALSADCVDVDSLSAEGRPADSRSASRRTGGELSAGSLADSVRAYREVA